MSHPHRLPTPAARPTDQGYSAAAARSITLYSLWVCVRKSLRGDHRLDRFSLLGRVHNGNKHVNIGDERGTGREHNIFRVDLCTFGQTLNAHNHKLGNMSRFYLEIEGVRFEFGDRAGERLTLKVHRNLNLHPLPLRHDNEIKVFDDLTHRILLHILHKRQMALARNVEGKHRVCLANKQTNLVRGQCKVLRLGAVPVEDGGNLADRAQPAGSALAERLTDSGLDDVLVGHDVLLAGSVP